MARLRARLPIRVGVDRPQGLSYLDELLMTAAVSLRLLYLIFQQVLRLVLLRGRTTSIKDVELLVLPHELAVLRRTNPRPRVDWADRAVFARPDPAAAYETA